MLQPEEWTVEGEPGQRRLVYRWWGLDAVFYGAIGLLFVGTGTMAFLTPEGPPPVFVAHWAVGAFLVYLSVCKCLNRTTYALGGGWFRVRHGPLWWPGAIDLPVESLHQLFVKRSSVRVNKQPRWRVMAADRHGVLHRASPLMPSMYHARWLEQTIEEELGIVDQRMLGEE
ncbi:MAG TPA: hypothetical protein PKY30_07580 [Myxococcota bacterium]|nr:hypothetical protein [Myxococcota bacterium]